LKTRLNSINAKLIILISAILSGTILVILFSTMWMLNGFQRKTVVQALQRTELLVNTLVTSKLQELRVQSSLVGELPILNTAVENGDINTIRDIAKTYKENLGVPIFDIMGRNGSLLTSVGEAFPPSDTVEKDLACMVMDAGFVSAVVNRGGKLALMAGAPIGVADDAGGVLLVGFTLDSAFAEKIRGFTKSEISFALVGNISGTSLAAEGRKALEQRLEEVGRQADQAGAAGYATMRGFAVHTVSLKDTHGKELGRTFIQMPLAEHQKMMTTLKLLLAGIGALVFAVACGITYRFSSTFTAPIADLVRFAQKLAGGDRDTPIAVNRSDELGNLQESLEKMRVALKELIENMDQRIKEGIQHVTNILDNLDSGFLIFDKQGKVQPGYSKISEEYFGEGLAGKKVEEILKIDPKVWANILSWRDIMFNNILPFKDACGLGPSSYEKLAGRHIELAYRPIRKGQDLDGVVLIASDKTVERELFRKFEEEKSRVDLIIKITTNRDAFMDFIRESRQFISELNQELSGVSTGAIDVESAFRTMHTLKGNSAMYSCNRIKAIAHEMESDLAEIKARNGQGFREYMPKLRAGLAALDEAVSNVLDSHKALLGEIGGDAVELRRVTVSTNALGILEKALLENFRRDSGIYRMFMENFVLEPILPSIKKLESAAQSLAERRQKLIKPVRWVGEEARVRIEHYKRLLAALVHFFRNAVDHGIEMPDEREAAGKDPEGQITVIIEKLVGDDDDPRLRLRMMDDGKGIDPAVIRAKIVEKGLIDAESAAKLDDDAVIQYVFKNGFSTNDTVTDVSGRGVGMDAIAYEAKKLSGRAWIKSQKGKGAEMVVEVAYLA
jgi:two-component system chemotaxis sensor kinase CheA